MDEIIIAKQSTEKYSLIKSSLNTEFSSSEYHLDSRILRIFIRNFAMNFGNIPQKPYLFWNLGRKTMKEEYFTSQYYNFLSKVTIGRNYNSKTIN